jgi:hypothetical protein
VHVIPSSIAEAHGDGPLWALMPCPALPRGVADLSEADSYGNPRVRAIGSSLRRSYARMLIDLAYQQWRPHCFGCNRHTRRHHQSARKQRNR